MNMNVVLLGHHYLLKRIAGRTAHPLTLTLLPGLTRPVWVNPSRRLYGAPTVF